MKKIATLCLFALFSCSSGTKGVGFSFIQEQFNLPAGETIMVTFNDSNTCPKIELDSSNSNTFKIRLEPGIPSNEQSTFAYADDEYKEVGTMHILRGKNDTGSAFEFTYDNDVTYTLTIDYNCTNAEEVDCSNTTYSCSGPLL